MTLKEYKKTRSGSFTKSTLNKYEKLVAAGCQIDFEINSSNTTWILQEFSDKKFVIIDPDKGQHPAGMAHELLHIEQSLKGFQHEHKIRVIYNGSNSLFGYLFGKSYIEEINNTLGHLKMIDDFLSLDFPIDFLLQVTQEQHFRSNVQKDLDCMLRLHNSNNVNICTQAIRFIIYCGTAKLAELSFKKELAQQIFDPLMKIDGNLLSKLSQLFDEWIGSSSFDNLDFYKKLNVILTECKIPYGAECPPESVIVVDPLCNQPTASADLFFSEDN